MCVNYEIYVQPSNKKNELTTKICNSGPTTTGLSCWAGRGHRGSTLNDLIKQLESSGPSWLAQAPPLASWASGRAGAVYFQ